MNIARYVCQSCTWSGDELHNDTCPNCGARRVVNQLEFHGHRSFTIAEMTPSQRFQLHAQWAATLAHYAATIDTISQALAMMSQAMEADPESENVARHVMGLGEWSNELAQQVREVSTYAPLHMVNVAPPVTPGKASDEEFPF